MLILTGTAAMAQQQPAPSTDTVTPKTESSKPDVRFLGKASTTTTVTKTRVGRRKKIREDKANAKSVQQYAVPKDTVSVKGDTIKIYKADTDTIKTQ